MSMYIGENIKRLRLMKSITQEKLAEYMNISAPAISKWERGETLPDITMIMPLAFYFGVTADELMGFDTARIEKDIQEQLDIYHELQKQFKTKESTKFIAGLYKEYPNNFEVIINYMYNIIGGRADNNKEKLISNADEILNLCNRILKECTIDSIRYEATHISAKIYRACGDIEKALTCYNNLPNWYESKNQLLEQLYDKDTEEFRYYVNKNLYDLLDFAFNKAGKAIWYTKNSVADRDNETNLIVGTINEYINKSGHELAYTFISNIYHEGAKVLNIEGEYEKSLEYYEQYLFYVKKYDDFITSDRQIGSMSNSLKSEIAFDYEKRVKKAAEWILSTPFLKEVRNLAKFNEVIEKYRLS